MGLCDDAADKKNPIFSLSHFLIVFFDYGTMGQWDYGSSFCALWVDVGSGR